MSKANPNTTPKKKSLDHHFFLHFEASYVIVNYKPPLDKKIIIIIMHCYAYKPHASSSTTKQQQPEKKKRIMASGAPIAIGTRGTVGALVRKEIEYFAKLELDRPRKPRGGSHSQQHVHHHHHHNGHQANWPSSLRFLVATWKKKKHRGSTRSFLPSLCSAAEVAEMKRLNGIPGFGYRPLRDDVSYTLEL